ncbi:hypothetical protein P170DRAFT_426785 [Aspergillus steynii IBT 23096]|uniref:Arrestin-like N-terminal domain-containing protein n=1 Tax=Aspergillus steynii IBT 23096 TaxID=1392250 RepID=A0A2I2G3T6_9EURO|nr:uncharacterized protein P170DRAFT_426785 [Aspergillus steynii IBT 23096]PLB47540.1 hypothetical protein P170DRAFT_426785 [Aspergillus steynii IBT 23096]
MAFQRPPSRVQICLASNQQHYGIGDTIQGEVLLTPQKRLLPEQLSKTEVEIDRNGNNIPLPPSIASSTFLHMKQPTGTHSSGISKALEAETQYRIPFEFVVPAELPHHICHHHRHHEQVYWEHTQLPPSIGTAVDFGRGEIAMRDDMAPAILFITYGIRVRIYSDKTQQNGGPAAIGEWTYPVHIRPQRKENPPVWVPDGSKFYCMRQDRQITKGIRRRPYTATRQDPLPEISGLDLRLKAVTTYGAEIWSDFPDLTDPSLWISSQDYYADTVPLHSSSDHQLIWQKSSVCEDPIYPANISVDLTHTTALELPITLPGHLNLPPSFHSCLVSRVYSLKPSLHVRIAGQWTNTKISLTVPIQIC